MGIISDPLREADGKIGFNTQEICWEDAYVKDENEGPGQADRVFRH